MALRIVLFGVWLMLPLVVGSVETTGIETLPVTTPRTESQQSSVTPFESRFSRAQWGLNETEWQRYRSLMQGIRGSISPGTLSPLEVLGIHARDDAERRDYARRWAVMMREDVERILAFQRAYDAAWATLNPAGTVIDPAKVPALSTVQATPTLQTGDRLLFFTRVSHCPACEPALAAVQRALSKFPGQLDIYFVDTPRDDAIRVWISQQGFDAERVRQGRITFNPHRGELQQVAGPAATAPRIVRLRGQSVDTLAPYQLW